jgi:tRNA-uridine 2-sulfurtransferase
MRKKVLVGMSGGVDSSVAVVLLKEQGYEVSGVFMNLGGRKKPVKSLLNLACCGSEGKEIEDVKKVAGILDIRLHIIEMTEEYNDIVLNYFKREYLRGRTPNPCVVCNRFLKFGILLEKARGEFKTPFDFFATGHYARVDYDSTVNRYVIKKAADRDKDQSYFLFLLTQKQLSQTLFPLGEYKKEEVREVAKKEKLPVSAKEESQDFINGDRSLLFEDRMEEGPVVDNSGNVLGRHKGIFRYTIGQRKGLGIAAKRPLYVIGINPAENSVVVGEKKDVYSRDLIADDVNLIGAEKIDAPVEVDAKIRYKHTAAPAVVESADERGKLRVRFEEPQWAITPGQAVVFYKGDVMLGGGFIKESSGGNIRNLPRTPFHKGGREVWGGAV